MPLEQYTTRTSTIGIDSFSDALASQYAKTQEIVSDLVFILGLEIPEIYALARKLGNSLPLNERLLLLREFYLEQGRLPEFLEEHKEESPLPRIGDTVGTCEKCGWTEKVDAMEPDIDGDGSLGCPGCSAVIVVRQL